MVKETLPPNSEYATPIKDENGKPVPGLLVFEVLHSNPKIAVEIKKFILAEQIAELKELS